MEAQTLQKQSQAPVDRRADADPSVARRPNAAIVAFGLALSVALAAALLQSQKPFYYDSLLYWNLGKSFTLHGHFSLLNFNSSLRGYLYPLVNHGLQDMATTLKWSNSYSAKIFNALLVALLGAVLAPRLAELTFPGYRWSVGRRLLLVGLLIIFWHGYLDYPLSDFPAVTAAVIALICAAKLNSPGSMFLAGLASGAAIDVRAAYILLAPCIVAVVVVMWWQGSAALTQHTQQRRIACAMLLVSGFIIISLPQSLASHRHFATWSFLPGTASHVEDLKLNEGIGIQRYDTYIGAGHPPRMEYGDPEGQRLLAQQSGSIGIDQYVSLVVHHPLTMGSVFLRHIVNGMDARYTTPYIAHLDTGTYRWRRVLGFTLLFLALLRLLWPAARHELGAAQWRWLAVLAICSLPAIPSDIEARYLLPLYLLSYVVVLMPHWPSLNMAGKGLRRYRRAALIVCSYSVFMALAYHIANGASQHLRFG